MTGRSNSGESWLSVILRAKDQCLTLEKRLATVWATWVVRGGRLRQFYDYGTILLIRVLRKRPLF